MPRERAHWFVLSEATKLLPKESLVRKALKTEAHWAYLGAVLPDAPYYKGKGTDSFAAEVGEKLHGCEGEDTFAIMRSWAKAIDSAPILPEQSPPIQPLPRNMDSWALWLGFLSHLVLDQEAHPMIFYFTGDYYHPDLRQRTLARARHRLLEVYLETLVPRSAEIPEYISDLCTATLGKSNLPLEFLAAQNFSAWSGSPLLPKGHTREQHFDFWRASVMDLAEAQHILLSPARGLFLRALSSIPFSLFLPPAARFSRLVEFDALFAFGRSNPGPLLSQILTYRNPASGEEFKKSPLEIFAEAAKRLAALFCAAEPALAGSVSDGSFLAPGEGTSLCFNLMGVRAAGAVHYSHQGLALHGLATR